MAVQIKVSVFPWHSCLKRNIFPRLSTPLCSKVWGYVTKSSFTKASQQSRKLSAVCIADFTQYFRQILLIQLIGSAAYYGARNCLSRVSAHCLKGLLLLFNIFRYFSVVGISLNVCGALRFTTLSSINSGPLWTQPASRTLTFHCSMTVQNNEPFEAYSPEFRLVNGSL